MTSLNPVSTGFSSAPPVSTPPQLTPAYVPIVYLSHPRSPEANPRTTFYLWSSGEFSELVSVRLGGGAGKPSSLFSNFLMIIGKCNFYCKKTFDLKLGFYFGYNSPSLTTFRKLIFSVHSNLLGRTAAATKIQQKIPISGNFCQTKFKIIKQN